MPGNDDPLLSIARVLGLFTALPQQQAQAEQQRAMYEGAGLTPQQAQAAFPDALFHGHVPGTGLPVLGGILRGVGQTGQLLQYILGDAPTAPRPTEQLSQMMLINNMQRRQRQDKARLDFEAAHPEEKPALEAGGSIDAAERRINPRASAATNPFSMAAGQAQSEGLKPGSPEYNARVAHLAGQFRTEAGMGKTPADADPDKGAPTQEKDLDREARRRFPNDEAKQYEWKKAQRIETAAGKTTATTTASQEVKDKYAKLPAAAQQTMSSIETLRGMVTQMREFLKDPAVVSNRGVFWGRVAQFLYSQGFADSPNEDGFIAAMNFVRIMGTQPFMRGRTGGMIFINQIQQHLAAAQDQPALLADKLDLIDNADPAKLGYTQRLEASILNAAEPIQKQRERVFGGKGEGAVPAEAPPPSDDLRQQHPEWFVQ